MKEDVEKGEGSCTVGGNGEVTATTEKSTKISQKAACRTTMMQRDISERHRHTHAYYTIHKS